MQTKYHFTPEMDKRIREAYRTEPWKGAINALAVKMMLPRWRVSRRAREIEAYEPKIKEKPWNEEELHILEQKAHLTPPRIQIALKKAGYTRSVTGIILKRKRMRFTANLKGMSARQCAECFGLECPKSVVRWIDKGLLRAKRRGTARVEEQGGDMWFIKEKDLRNFIVENIGLIDIRKVDKFWFVDILANAGRDAREQL
jgi:hypothetical protein